MTVFEPRPVPPLTAPRSSPPLSTASSRLDSGLKVVAVRRGGAPLVQLRLFVPFAGEEDTHLAKTSLLAASMLSGTERHSSAGLAAALQTLGADLTVNRSPDRLLISGETLAGGLPQMLELLAEALTTASYPHTEVIGERSRALENVRIARSQPATAAKEALLHRMFGPHPYGREIPDPDLLQSVTPAQVRALHHAQVLPCSSTLALVGDITLDSALDDVAKAMSCWDTPGSAPPIPPVPPLKPGPVALVDRPGSVQSSIRMGGVALGRSQPDYAALQLANTIFAGYFSSRLIENIREDKGYTYSPHSMVEHARAGSNIQLHVDVASEVTAPALLEIGYELGRIATQPVGDQELDSARQYLLGSLALASATQSGLADLIVQLITSGLDIDWLAEHPGRLAAVTVEQVHEQAARFLAPTRLVTVILGDATHIEPSLRTLTDVERQ
ncbi:MAG: M16 family metallopeptidase [Egibacteraceae bacterium]